MKRFLSLAGAGLLGLIPGVVSAQNPQNPAALNPAARPMPVLPGTPPYGNILYPGGANNFPSALGGTVSGSRPYTGVPPGYTGGPRPSPRPRTVVVPYAVPVYAGPGYYEPQAPATTNVTVVVPQQPTPSVIINQTFNQGDPPAMEVVAGSENRSLRVYESPRRVEPPAAAPAAAAAPPVAPAPVVAAGSAGAPRDDRPTIYLIALKDTTVRQAIGYWVEGENLAYVTPRAVINRVSLDNVDRELSIQLNAERKLDFDPKPR